MNKIRCVFVFHFKTADKKLFKREGIGIQNKSSQIQN